MVIIDVSNMACMDGCKVDDLVMVIGKIVFEEEAENQLHDMKGNAWSEVVHLITKYPVSASQCFTTPETKKVEEHEEHNDDGMDHVQQRHVFGYVESKIVRVINGLDMNLFQQALQLRREYLSNLDRYGVCENGHTAQQHDELDVGR